MLIPEWQNSYISKIGKTLSQIIAMIILANHILFVTHTRWLEGIWIISDDWLGIHTNNADCNFSLKKIAIKLSDQPKFT